MKFFSIDARHVWHIIINLLDNHTLGNLNRTNKIFYVITKGELEGRKAIRKYFYKWKNNTLKQIRKKASNKLESNYPYNVAYMPIHHWDDWCKGKRYLSDIPTFLQKTIRLEVSILFDFCEKHDHPFLHKYFSLYCLVCCCIYPNKHNIETWLYDSTNILLLDFLERMTGICFLKEILPL